MSDTAPLLSIVTICKNADKTIEKTFTSIAAQTCKEFEYIVYDGASTDDTVTLIKQYAHVIDRWQSEPDEGPYQPANHSFEHAKGQFVAFLYADDWLAPDAAEQIIAAIKKQPTADIIGYRLMEHKADQSGALLPIRIFTEPNKDFDLQTGLYCHGANRAYRRQLIANMGGFDVANYNQMADRDLFIRLGLKGVKKHFIDSPLYHFLVHPGSNTTSGASKHGIIAMREYIQIARAHMAATRDPNIIHTMRYWHSYASIRLAYFQVKHGHALQACIELFNAFAAYPVAFMRALVYLRTPPQFAPKRLNTRG